MPAGQPTPARPAPAAAPTAPERLIAWVRKRPQLVMWVAGAVILAVGLVWWNMAATRQSEAEARNSLQSARVAFESRNLGLAASELSRVRENYSGTKASEEATLLLAQVRMLQGQRDQAIQMLRDFAPGASREYRAQAYGLLGAALENGAKLPEAAQAYESAAVEAPLAFLKAQYYVDAGRAWVAAGDTARAIATYRRVIADLKETSAATEAFVRLGELTKGAGAP